MSTSKLKVAKEKKMKAYFGVHNLKKKTLQLKLTMIGCVLKLKGCLEINNYITK